VILGGIVFHGFFPRERKAVPKYRTADYVATNAANTQMNVVHYIKHNLYFVYVTAVVVVLSAVVTLLHWICGGVMVVSGLGLLLLHLWLKAKQHREGTTNAAVVTSLDPFCVAVLGDLSLVGGKSFPAIQIVEMVDPTDGRAKVGTKLPMVCDYVCDEMDGNTERWDDMLVTPIMIVTPDPKAVEHAMRLIPAKEWSMLEKNLKLVPDVQKPGVHLIPGTLL
jgi:hypothetical protein